MNNTKNNVFCTECSRKIEGNQCTKNNEHLNDGYLFVMFRYIINALGLYKFNETGEDLRSCSDVVNQNCTKLSKSSPKCSSMSCCSCSQLNTSEISPSCSPNVNDIVLEPGRDNTKQPCKTIEITKYNSEMVGTICKKLSYIISSTCSVIETLINQNVESQEPSKLYNEKPNITCNGTCSTSAAKLPSTRCTKTEHPVCSTKCEQPPTKINVKPSIELPKPKIAATKSKDKTPKVKIAAKKPEQQSCFTKIPIKKLPIKIVPVKKSNNQKIEN